MPSKVNHRRVLDPQGPIMPRLMAVESSIGDITEKLPTWIANGVLEVSKKLYNELYADLAAEHGRVFEVQEAAFMAVTAELHQRIATLEEQSGIVPPELASIRATVDAIGEYFGDVAQGTHTPWADLTHDERAIIVWNRIRCQRELAQHAEPDATGEAP